MDVCIRCRAQQIAEGGGDKGQRRQGKGKETRGSGMEAVGWKRAGIGRARIGMEEKQDDEKGREVKSVYAFCSSLGGCLQ